jgi:tetratricopeptide (TPR) repeat protein
VPPSDPKAIRSAQDILQNVLQPKNIGLNCSTLRKGIDNYLVDVRLSADYVNLGRELIEIYTRQAVSGAKLNSPDLLDRFRLSYSDMLSATLHRTKTDLTPTQIGILQFAVIKYVLSETRSQLTAMLQQLEDTLAQQQYSGSRSLMATQARFALMRKNYDDFQYRVNQAIFKSLQREDVNHLRQLRDEQLQGTFREALNVMYNPLLASANPQSPRLLMEHYALWPAAGFSDANARVESALQHHFPELVQVPLLPERLEALSSEVYDELGGLFAAQGLLGQAENQQEQLTEVFSWLEQPSNMRLLFDANMHQAAASVIRADVGIKAQWRFNSELKKFAKALAEMRKAFASDDEYRLMLAGYQLRKFWSDNDLELIDINQAARYIAGIEVKKTAVRLGQLEKGGPELLKRLDELAKQNQQQFKEGASELILRCFTDYCRYRLHLRYYRLAHRVFNRLHIIIEAEQIHLSKTSGHLYELLGQEELAQSADVEPEIVHHTIFKADVRGSTTVTQELIRQNLNPASYFSLRFFEPIKQLLAVYGAAKVFIEGDAVILATHEYNNAPDQWYSVARSCGIAKDMLDIVSSKNAHSKQTGLPELEIGVGIAYADEKPLFLFDDKQPIMISSAIGLADRMSSCSWKLRQHFDTGIFNVEVLQISASDRQSGEKGQSQLRYNVNGILLTTDAFTKLKSEINLKSVRVNLADGVHTMYVGKFPDMAGKKRELVVRQGQVKIWEHGEVLPANDASGVFFEVLPNSKIASQVLEATRKHE